MPRTRRVPAAAATAADSAAVGLLCARRQTVRGRGGGIPALLFRQQVQSVTLKAHEDEEYYEKSGPLFASYEGIEGVDVDGSFGVERRSVNVEAECSHECARTKDPLPGAFLRRVRAEYLERCPLDLDYEGMAGFEPFIQDFIQYKTVCTELLAAYSRFWSEESAEIEWEAFGASTSDDSYAVSVSMRSGLAAAALSLAE